jgi:phosphatidylserine/phosphatidylglycerophosphate/cardiolipin synthase-like enzyme
VGALDRTYLPSWDHLFRWQARQEPVSSEPVSDCGFGQYQRFTITSKTSTFVLFSLLGVGAGGVVVATIALSLPLVIIPVAWIGVAIVGVRAYLDDQALRARFLFDLTQGLNPEDFQAKRVGELVQENGAAVVLSDATESKRYKLDLIRHAEQSIFFSSYMGEESLDEALDLIKERMEQKRDLKVFILSSDQFLTPDNKRRLEALKASHPDRFFHVLTPEIYYSEHPSGGGARLSTNHIKLMAIDQGAYTISGGCALRSFWTDVTGTSHLPRLENASLFNLLNLLEAKRFRDMDFAFKSAPRGAGTTSFLEGAKLMLRYAYMQDPALAEKLKQQFLGLMRAQPIATTVPSIDTHPQRVGGLFGMQVYATGPDHVRNSYLHALIDLVNRAQRKIVVAQMYFHPPQVLIDALIRASERGVKIEVITNSKDREAPFAHRFFSDMGQINYRQLFEGRGAENVKVHEFHRANTTYHKKVVIVDDQYTAFGSSNFGAKSLEENPADYEFNSVVHSQPFAARTMDILNTDIALSTQIDPELARNPSLQTRVFAWFQERLMTPLL